jgi:hypothetical protein
MDILNFISWIKSGEYRTTLPTDTPSLIPVGAKDPTRDDGYRSLAINAAPLQTLYNTGNATQLTSITTAVTVDAHNGIITTVSSTLAAATEAVFTVNNPVVTAASRVIVSVEYDEATNGFPLANVADIANGSFKVVLLNAGAAALAGVVKIHFIIIN